MSLRVERRGPVLVVALDRPEKRNAINAAMTSALDVAFDEFEDDPRLRVAVLAVEGPVFCAGSDLVDGPGPPTARGGPYGVARRHPRKPVIAAVDGPAVGGGFELVLACDLVVASRTADFRLPEAARGRIANAGGHFRAAARLPENLAVELLRIGDRLTAERAHDVGLVNRLTEPGDAVGGALAPAAALCRSSPASVEQTLGSLRAMRVDDERAGWSVTAEAALRVTGSADRAEGDAAFRERRKPHWVIPAAEIVQPPPEVAMTREELDAFLAQQRFCHVADSTVEGTPVTPLRFVWDGSALWLNSTVRRWYEFGRDHPRVSVAIDTGERHDGPRGVTLTGRVTGVSEVPRTGASKTVAAEAERLYAEKYSEAPAFHPAGRPRMAPAGAREDRELGLPEGGKPALR